MKDFDLVIPAQLALWVLQPHVLCSQYLIVPQSIWCCMAWWTNGTQDRNRKCPHFTDGEDEVQKAYLLCAGSFIHSPWEPALTAMPPPIAWGCPDQTREGVVGWICPPLGAHLLVDFTTQALSACFWCFLKLAPGNSKFNMVLVQVVWWYNGTRSRPSPGRLSPTLAIAIFQFFKVGKCSQQLFSFPPSTGRRRKGE